MNNKEEIYIYGKVLTPIIFVLSIISLLVGNYYYFFFSEKRGGAGLKELIIMNIFFTLGIFLSSYLYKKLWKRL